MQSHRKQDGCMHQPQNQIGIEKMIERPAWVKGGQVTEFKWDEQKECEEGREASHQYMALLWANKSRDQSRNKDQHKNEGRKRCDELLNRLPSLHGCPTEQEEVN